eukprot:TRINITY_DN12327_c1_g2_i1.p1 TRINITY_DN12327_c1_g2~~TRINITY_DN12327_c1_g2_i1.p1  ORF type:complete len:185 (+),score=59.57 TRINITY_DN12327_c1_g2_i1:87-641(+)
MASSASAFGSKRDLRAHKNARDDDVADKNSKLQADELEEFQSTRNDDFKPFDLDDQNAQEEQAILPNNATLQLDQAQQESEAFGTVQGETLDSIMKKLSRQIEGRLKAEYETKLVKQQAEKLEQLAKQQAKKLEDLAKQQAKQQEEFAKQQEEFAKQQANTGKYVCASVPSASRSPAYLERTGR